MEKEITPGDLERAAMFLRILSERMKTQLVGTHDPHDRSDIQETVHLIGELQGRLSAAAKVQMPDDSGKHIG